MGKLKQHKTVIENTMFLSIIEFVNMLVPILALPYVIRVIGKDNYGLIAFAQSIIAYFAIFINFGLNISAVKSVSENRYDKSKISEIISSVICIKFMIWCMIAILYTICIFAISELRIRWELYVFAFIITIFEIIFPQWYFQGVEKMKYITLVRLTSVVFYLSTLFFVVKSSDDYFYVPLLQSLGAILSGVIGLALLVRVEKVRYVLPTKEQIIVTVKESRPFLFSQLSKVINENIAITMSGIFLSMGDTAVLNLAKKIINFASTPGEMLCNALYPRNSLSKDKAYFRKFLLFIILAMLFEVVVTYFLVPYIVYFFASNIMPEVIWVVRAYLVYLMFLPVVTYIGYSGLVAFGHSKDFNRSIYVSVIVQLLIYLILCLFQTFNIYAFVVANTLSMASILIYRLFACREYKLL